MRDQVHRKEQQGDDKRVHHHAHGLDDHLFAATHHRQQAEDQHKRQQRPWRRHDVQLVLHKAADRVGQGHAVDQQDRENREEVQQGDQCTRFDTEMLFDHISNVRTFTAGEHKTGQPTVGKEGHRKRQHCQDHQRPETAQAGVDWQEQGTGANGGAEQAKHPGGVLAAPACEGCRCRCIAFVDAIGLIIHPVGSPHLHGRDESEKPDRQRPDHRRGRIVRDSFE